MNTATAIAAATEALRVVVESAIDGLGAAGGATSKPPDEAHKDNGNRVNVFLYHVAVNAAWRNRDLPSRSREGESGKPLLPVNLYYLITAYSAGNDDVSAHTFLGHVMRRLHSRPVFQPAELQPVLQEQFEPIRITLQPLALDEISKLWASFQAPYRPSVVYELAPVLIDHELPGAAPLPVMQRGEGDRGWDAGVAAMPAIESFQYVPKAELDEIVAGRRQLPSAGVAKRAFGVSLQGGLLLAGRALARAGAIAIEFRRLPLHEGGEGPLGPLVRRLEPSKVAADALLADLSRSNPEEWPAGRYSVSVRYGDHDDRALRTNAITIALVPRIVQLEQTALPAPGGSRLTIAFTPPLHGDQRVSVLAGARAFIPEVADRYRIHVNLPVDFPSVDTPVRLRIDGADSLLYDADTPVGQAPRYDESLMAKPPA